MFIIFGSPRSGTTLLSTSLDLNDHIIVPDETDFLIPVAFIYDRVKDERVGKSLIVNLIISTKSFSHTIGEFLSEIEVQKIINDSEYTLESMIGNIYHEIARKNNAILSGDKSPNDLNFCRILAQTGLFDSNIKVIHIIRDIRDVVLSLKGVSWSAPNIETFFPRFWSNANLYLHELLKNKSNKYILVKYEDFIQNPKETLSKLTDFLNVPFQEKMLQHNNRGYRYREAVHHVNLNKPFLGDKISEWRIRMDNVLRNQVEAQASEAIQKFGYPL